jgi:hypothetical protein
VRVRRCGCIDIGIGVASFAPIAGEPGIDGIASSPAAPVPAAEPGRPCSGISGVSSGDVLCGAVLATAGRTAGSIFGEDTTVELLEVERRLGRGGSAVREGRRWREDAEVSLERLARCWW